MKPALVFLLMLVPALASAAPPTDDMIAAEVKSSFNAKGQATLERLDRTSAQVQCSAYAASGKLPQATLAKIASDAMASVKFPADGQYLGDWRRGEKIAQTGTGMQYSDNPEDPNGGNCYACHELSTKEIAYGNIGPSMKSYGKIRGSTDAVLKYTWTKIWNSHAYMPCSQMPRYGAAGILTEAQIKDVMALLFDAASPVNQ